MTEKLLQYIWQFQYFNRAHLYSTTGETVEIIVHPTDESYPDNLSPQQVAEYIAAEKAKAVLPLAKEEQTVIAADTIVVLDNEIIGKPTDRDHAIETLSKLSGATHHVITGVSICNKNKDLLFSDTTLVQFHHLSKEQIQFYVDKYKPYDKAGAYAIQEWIGVVGIKCINGDFYNVMGLPVSRVVHALQQF